MDKHICECVLDRYTNKYLFNSPTNFGRFVEVTIYLKENHVFDFSLMDLYINDLELHFDYLFNVIMFHLKPPIYDDNKIVFMIDLLFFTNHLDIQNFELCINLCEDCDLEDDNIEKIEYVYTEMIFDNLDSYKHLHESVYSNESIRYIDNYCEIMYWNIQNEPDFICITVEKNMKINEIVYDNKKIDMNDICIYDNNDKKTTFVAKCDVTISSKDWHLWYNRDICINDNYEYHPIFVKIYYELNDTCNIDNENVTICFTSIDTINEQFYNEDL